MGQSTWGLISRVSSRTYRFLKNSLTFFFKMADRESRTIFCRNLSWNATQDMLFAVAQFQNAADIKIPTDREIGRPRGFCFIEFNTAEECQQALATTQGLEIDGREVILAQSQPREAQSGGRGGYGGGRGGGRGGYQGGNGGGRGGYQGGNGGY